MARLARDRASERPTRLAPVPYDPSRPRREQDRERKRVRSAEIRAERKVAMQEIMAYVEARQVVLRTKQLGHPPPPPPPKPVKPLPLPPPEKPDAAPIAARRRAAVDRALAIATAEQMPMAEG